MTRICIFVVFSFALFAPGSPTAEIYRWVDPEGQTHYSSVAPESGQAERIELPSQVETSQPPAQEAPETPLLPTEVIETDATVKKSLTFEELGDLPENEESKYLETIDCGILYDIRNLSAKYNLSLKAKSGLPFGAVLDVHFENPLDTGVPITATKRRLGGENEVLIISPPVSGLQCGNYQVDISIYRTSEKTRLVGQHKQIIQSRINMRKIKNRKQFADVMTKGNCP